MARPPPPIIFEPQILPEQTIYRWKGNLTANRIHFKYLRNISISRFYEQFSRNGSAMALERMFEKISNFKIMNILYIILKHVVWRFRIYNYFCGIFKFREIYFCSYFREIKIFYFVKLCRLQKISKTIGKTIVYCS